MNAPHSVTESMTFLQVYPAHEPRETDPHYAAFHEARARLEKLGALRCWINNADCSLSYPIELHHSTVEFALTNDVDPDKFRQLYPEFSIADDDAFLTWVESEGNLLPLCKMHHTGILGIHTVHYPGWLVQRVLKEGVSAPERKVDVPALPHGGTLPRSATATAPFLIPRYTFAQGGNYDER